MKIERAGYLKELIDRKGNGLVKVATGNPFEKPWSDAIGIEYIGILPFLLDERFLSA